MSNLQKLHGHWAAPQRGGRNVVVEAGTSIERRDKIMHLL